MVMTTRGIYHNLDESKYSVFYKDTLLFFSSKFYLNKYLREYEGYRETFKRQHKALSKEFDECIDLLSDLYFYKTIEKRGFRVDIGGESCKWQEIVVYVLLNVTEKSIISWREMSEGKLIEYKNNTGLI